MAKRISLKQVATIGLVSAILIWTFITLEMQIISQKSTSGIKWTYLLTENDDDVNEINDIINSELHDVILANSQPCSKISRPTKSQLKFVQSEWQQVSLSDATRDAFVYDVYYDDRPAAGFLPQLRLLAIMTHLKNKENDVRAFCHIWYSKENSPYFIEAIVNYTGMTEYFMKGKQYKEYTCTCPLPVVYPIPTHVSLTLELCQTNQTTFNRVRYSTRRKPQIDFGVCVVNGYGKVPVEEFVEWMELHMMLGVAEFQLYDSRYSVDMNPVFDYYKRKGVLHVRSLPHPLNLTGDWYHKVRTLRTISLNDCMLRNMYRYRYIIVIDHDEVVVPTTANNYSQLLKQIDANLNLSEPSFSYTFDNLYFLSEFPEDEKKPKYLKTLRYRNRAWPNQEFLYYATKSFVSPLACSNLFNHYCAKRLPPYDSEVSTIVSSKMAGSHHYRKCGKFYRSSCDILLKQKTADDSILRFENNLTSRVVPILKHFNIL